LPVEPWNWADPKVKMPPSDPTSQYPWLAGGGAAAATFKVVVPLDVEKRELPPNVPVMVSLPTGAEVALQDPVPLTRFPVVHNPVEPVAKVTVPVGVPPPEVTVAV